SPDPTPLHLMLLNQCIERLPQICVTHRLAISRQPATAFPVHEPLAHAFLHILGISVHDHMTRSLEGAQCFNHRQKLHAIVRGLWLAAIQFFLVSPVLQECSPAPRTGVPLAGTVSPDFDNMCFSLNPCSLPFALKRLRLMTRTLPLAQ